MISEQTNIEIPNDVAAEPCAGGYLLRGTRSASFHEAEFGPISLPGLRRYVAISQFNSFMCEPRWGEDLSQIPDECQFLLWRMHGGDCGIMMPLLSGDFRTRIKGAEGGMSLFTECSPGGTPAESLPLAYLQYGSDPHELIQTAMSEVIRLTGLCRPRADKPVPDFVNYIGWCTWDAFYEDVDQARIVEGLKSFKESGLMPGFVIVDEGWQDTDEKKFLTSYGAKEGFEGRRMRSTVEIAKRDFGVRYMACWRTLFGALRAIQPASPQLSHLKSHIVDEIGTNGDQFGVVEPGSVHQFQDEYAAQLAEDGVDFVKVDFQSALRFMTYDHAGRVGAMTNWQRALQDSVKKHFGGMIINCMSGTTDAVYNYHESTVTRSSDDFFPGAGDESLQPRHIVQNAFNGLWMGEVCVCDWDMFWSDHHWAEYHAMARAISGGPIYVSDKPGKNNAKLLGKLIAADGRTLRCPQPALPTRDVLFVDYKTERVLFKAFNKCGDIGIVGVFHPHPDGNAISESVSPTLVKGLQPGNYAVWSARSGFLGMVDSANVKLSPRQADVLTFSPVKSGFAPIGLIDKFNPAAAILGTTASQNGITINLRGGGLAAVYSERLVMKVLMDGESVEFEQNNGCVVVDTGARETCSITIDC